MLHRMLSQIKVEKMTVPWKMVLAEAMFAKNILLSVNGISPYVALFGRFPRILECMESAGLSMIDDSHGPHKRVTPVREIA